MKAAIASNARQPDEGGEKTTKPIEPENTGVSSSVANDSHQPKKPSLKLKKGAKPKLTAKEKRERAVRIQDYSVGLSVFDLM